MLPGDYAVIDETLSCYSCHAVAPDYPQPRCFKCGEPTELIVDIYIADVDGDDEGRPIAHQSSILEQAIVTDEEAWQKLKFLIEHAHEISSKLRCLALALREEVTKAPIGKRNSRLEQLIITTEDLLK